MFDCPMTNCFLYELCAAANTGNCEIEDMQAHSEAAREYVRQPISLEDERKLEAYHGC